MALAAPRGVRDLFPRLHCRHVRAGALSRPRLLSVGRWRPHPDARAPAPVGTRVEESARQFAEIEKVVRQIIPPDELETLVDNIGFPVSGINMTYNNTGTIGSQDGEIQIGLSEDHRPTADYVRTLREELPARFPGVTFSFLPADIISQILNFGAPAPIEVQIRGPHLDENFAYAQNLLRRLRHVPGLVDARIQQSLSEPAFNVDVDRTRAQYVGITERDVTNSMVVNLAGSSQVQPTFWLNPDNGVNYSIVMQTPQYQVDSLNALQNLPITAAGAPSQVLGGIADVKRTAVPAVYSQYNVQPVIQIYGTTQGRDLGAVAADVQKIVDETAKDAPKTADVAMLGQVKTMNSSFSGLIFGLAAAIVLIYLLIVVNFQSWADPFVIITALPAALAGIVWMLFATGTTLSVPALDRRHHVHGRSHRQQRPRHQLRQGKARRARRRGCRRDRSGLCPPAPGPDDGSRHDHRHAADGARPRRRRRAERTARPRGRRRPLFRNRRNSDIRTGRLQHHPSTPRPVAAAPRSENRMSPDAPRPPPAVSRRGLYIAGFSALIVARRDRRLRHHDAQSRRRQATGMDRETGGPSRRRRAAGYCAAKRRRSRFPAGWKPTRRRRCMPASAAT